MQVRVRLFAALRERAGAEEVELELPDGARVKDALLRLEGLTGGVPVVMAVNHEYADFGWLDWRSARERHGRAPVAGGVG